MNTPVSFSEIIIPDVARCPAHVQGPICNAEGEILGYYVRHFGASDVLNKDLEWAWAGNAHHWPTAQDAFEAALKARDRDVVSRETGKMSSTEQMLEIGKLLSQVLTPLNRLGRLLQDSLESRSNEMLNAAMLENNQEYHRQVNDLCAKRNELERRLGKAIPELHRALQLETTGVPSDSTHVNRLKQLISELEAPLP